MSDQENAPENADELAALAAEADSIEPNTDADTGEQLPAEREQEGLTNEQVLQMALGPLFAILAPNWQVQPGEIEQLAAAYVPVLEKWLPGDLSLGVELQALMVTAMIIAPRAGTPRSDAAAEKAAKRKAQRQSAADDKARAERAATAQPADDGQTIDMSGLTDDGSETPGAEHEPAA